MKPLPIGVSDFKEIIDRDSYYVDKSLLIRDIVDKRLGVYLFPRPRRFGKTLNLNMLKYFFEKSSEDTSYLFSGLKIWEHEAYRVEQGQYPVIYLTFKDVKNITWDLTFESVKLLMRDVYLQHMEQLKRLGLGKSELGTIDRIISLVASQAEYEMCLKKLSEYLYKINNKKVIILIDEYDMPITGGFTYGFYDNIIGFMRNFLSGALKDNSALYVACLTGILRVARESIFSGLNNLYVSSILEEKFSEHFGFTEEEVTAIAENHSMAHKLPEVKNWYNGYRFGETDIYNPWSIVNYFERNMDYPQPYWINTSSNDLIENLLARSGSSIKKDFEILIENGTIEKPIDDNIVYGDIYTSEDALWSFLLMSGYLKSIDEQFHPESNIICTLKIPNLEVMYFYRKTFKNWLGISTDSDNVKLMLKSLVVGEASDFEYLINQLLLKTISYFDNNESFYHGFVLGLLVELHDHYLVHSNRESGLGRYDVMLEPKNKSANGIIIEFKSILRESDNDVEKACAEAMKQIEEKAYATALIENGIKNIFKYAVVFKGKQCFVLFAGSV